MKWNDTGIILTIKKSTERSLIVTILTEYHGLYKGYCNFSKKSMSTIQIGNIVHIKWNARLPTHLGRFDLELLESIPAFFLHHYKKMIAFSAISKTIARLLPEKEIHKKIYIKYYTLLYHLKKFEIWLPHYIKLELTILTELGFGLDFSKCPINNTTDDLTFISPKTGRVISQTVGMPYKNKLLTLPLILRQVNYTQEDIHCSDVEFAQCLTVTNYFLYKHCFHPYKISIPIERQLLYNAYIN